MTRLSAATLPALSPSAAPLRYDRAAVRTGVVHLGVGAFHRAHQAVYFDDVIAAGDPRWGIVGAALRSPEAGRQLNPQDGLYTVVERDGAVERTRLVGALRRVLTAPEDPAALLAALADPAVQLVTLTVTEKGYLSDPAETLTAPATPAGYIAAALQARRQAGTGAFTALSCDNLPRNGDRLERAALDIAERADPGLADWIRRHGAFPETMVDRIVPATTPADIDAAQARLGLRDEGMVKTEPFRQWVIQDRFAAERPALEAVGVQMTADVAPWEAAKLRMLNGAHSAMAYLGGLAGVEFVHAFVADPQGRRFVEALWDETSATLTPPPGLDLDAYRAALMARFANPALQHRTRQIAMDGSQKLPQRLIAPLLVRRQRGLASPALTLAVAGWMRWQDGRDDRGQAFPVEDPLALELAARIAGARDARATVQALLAGEAVFPPALMADDPLVDALTAALDNLRRHGASAAVARGAG